MSGLWVPMVKDTIFINNSVSNISSIGVGANAGGGMYAVGTAKGISNLTMTNVNFTNNSAFTGAGLEVIIWGNLSVPHISCSSAVCMI